jgi:4-amino-4-deoxy-L-arabinose transferase-like glycosyltransferase
VSPGGAGKGMRAAVFAAFAAAVPLAAIIFTRVLRPSGPLDWDEGSHALLGLRAFESLRGGHLARFLYDSYRLVYWPPLHTWYLAALYAAFGVSAETARLGSLFALVAAAPIVAAAGARLGGAPAGIVAALAFVLSPGVLVLSSAALLELPALFLLVLSIALFVRMTPDRGGGALGFAVAATYLTKSNYGVVFALALVLTCGVGGMWRWRSVRAAAGSLAGVLGFWFLWLPKIATTVRDFALPLPGSPDPWSADGLLFYPRALLHLAGSTPLALLWIGAFVLSLTPALLRANAVVRLLVLVVAVQMALAETSPNKLDRHVLPVVPAFALLAGFQVSRLLQASGRPMRMAALAGLAGVTVIALREVRSLKPSAPEGADVLAALASQPPGRTLLLSSMDARLAPATEDFALVASRRMPIEGSGALVTASEHEGVESLAPRLPDAFARWLRAEAARWPGTASYSAHLGLPSGDPAARWTPANLEERLRDVLRRAPVDRIVVVPGTGRVFPESTEDFFSGVVERQGFTREAGLSLPVFRRPPAAASAPAAP